MNKSELVEAVAKNSGLSKADTGRVLDALTATIQRELKRGQEVQLTGFGKFSVTKRGARKGRNPATGEPIRIKASKTPKFTAGKALKDTVSGARK